MKFDTEQHIYNSITIVSMADDRHIKIILAITQQPIAQFQ